MPILAYRNRLSFPSERLTPGADSLIRPHFASYATRGQVDAAAAMSDAVSKAALVVVDLQEDFCEPNGSLAVKGGRELAPVINQLLELPGFVVKIAARDFHPRDHVSFASNHPGATAFTSSFTIANPENENETQLTYEVSICSCSILHC